MKTTKNFSFSDFVSFSESLVDSLDAVATKIEEVTNQITTLETVLEGDAPAEEPVSAEENVSSPEENVASEEAPVEETAGEAEITPEGTEEVAETSEEVASEEASIADEPAEEADTAEEPVSEEANDAAAIDALSTGDENFSEGKFLVVGLKNRPWGNRVIAAKEFSEEEHRKLIPTMFSTHAQAQRALTAYNVNGENFSIKAMHNSNIVNMSEAKPNRYDTVKSIFNM